MDVNGVRMSDVARILSVALDRPVLDRTGLHGLFDIDTRLRMPDLPQFPPRREPGLDAAYPSLFTAFREDLNLKLESRREPLPVLIVEHVEPPIDN